MLKAAKEFSGSILDLKSSLGLGVFRFFASFATDLIFVTFESRGKHYQKESLKLLPFHVQISAKRKEVCFFLKKKQHFFI